MGYPVQHLPPVSFDSLRRLFPQHGRSETPAAEAEPDGSNVIYFSPTQPDGVAAGNWIQTDPGKGWFVLLRLYSPLQPYFDKSWRPSEIELVS